MNILQGMTPTDLKEAQKIRSLEDGKNEDSSRLEDRSCLRMSLTDDRRVQPGVTEYTETTDVSLNWSQMDEVTRQNYSEIVFCLRCG